MEIGNEISQKIRSAIKAKLVDLGVYVDDELPDYIMVMVANKKSQDQMTEDLNLFLSNNTEKFTSWLHALLTKLQSITADPPKAPPGEATETAVKETPEQDEDQLLIAPEHDDFEEEANREVVGATATATSVPRPSPHPQPNTVSETVANRRTETRSSVRESRGAQSKIWSTRESTGRPSHDTSRRREHSPRRDIRSRLGPSAQGSERLSESTLQRQRAAVRKRRAPESIVGSVVRHDIEEEQYDPRRPLIGRVASTVKVGDRRPTVPPGQQANKSLLLKAMTEARDSIAKATARLTEQVQMEDEEPVPEPRRIGSNRTFDQERDREQPGLRAWGTRGRSRPRIEPRGTMRSSGSSQPITRVAPQPAMQSSSNGAAGRSVELYSRSKREEVLQQFRAGLHSDSEDMADQESEEIPVRTQAPVILDNRQIHLGSQEEDSILEPETEQRTISMAPIRSEHRQEEEVLDTLIESGAEESDFTDEEGEARIVQETQMEPPKERPSSPKFVVTLDGVDPTALAASTEEDMDDSELEMQNYGDSHKPATIVRVKPQRNTSTPNAMDLFSQYYPDVSFDEEDSLGSPPKRAKVSTKMERCKFWLACRNGNDCPYIHPSVPCKMFPKCKFGDKCLYIHPNCRFDANCTRANCPFTHATKRSSQPGPTAVPVVIQPYSVVAAPPTFQSFSAPAIPAQQQPHAPATCRFFPKCTNMSCKFLHPKPCRYGLGCRDKEACTYTHPELPPTSKLKWTAPNINRNLSVDSGSSLR